MRFLLLAQALVGIIALIVGIEAAAQTSTTTSTTTLTKAVTKTTTSTSTSVLTRTALSTTTVSAISTVTHYSTSTQPGTSTVLSTKVITSTVYATQTQTQTKTQTTFLTTVSTSTIYNATTTATRVFTVYDALSTTTAYTTPPVCTAFATDASVPFIETFDCDSWVRWTDLSANAGYYSADTLQTVSPGYNDSLQAGMVVGGEYAEPDPLLKILSPTYAVVPGYRYSVSFALQLVSNLTLETFTVTNGAGGGETLLSYGAHTQPLPAPPGSWAVYTATFVATQATDQLEFVFRSLDTPAGYPVLYLLDDIIVQLVDLTDYFGGDVTKGPDLVADGGFESAANSSAWTVYRPFNANVSFSASPGHANSSHALAVSLAAGEASVTVQQSLAAALVPGAVYLMGMSYRYDSWLNGTDSDGDATTCSIQMSVSIGTGAAIYVAPPVGGAAAGFSVSGAPLPAPGTWAMSVMPLIGSVGASAPVVNLRFFCSELANVLWVDDVSLVLVTPK